MGLHSVRIGVRAWVGSSILREITALISTGIISLNSFIQAASYGIGAMAQFGGKDYAPTFLGKVNK